MSATFLLVRTADGRHEASALTHVLSNGLPICVLYAASGETSDLSVSALAAAVGRPVTDLRQSQGVTLHGGPPLLEQLADLHRGETVLLVGGRDLMRSALGAVMAGRGQLAALVSADEPADAVAVRIDVDADGWRIRQQASGQP